MTLFYPLRTKKEVVSGLRTRPLRAVILRPGLAQSGLRGAPVVQTRSGAVRARRVSDSLGVVDVRCPFQSRGGTATQKERK